MKLADESFLIKRFSYKLFTNIVSLAINLITFSIIPRGLGPKAFGDFNFLTGFFTQVVNFFDMGTSICFYTKLSQRQKDSGLVSFYFRFVLTVFSLTLALVYLTHLTPASAKIWPDQKFIFIFLASLWAALSWVLQIINQMNDAHGLTVTSEKARIIQKFLGLGIICLMYVFGQINLFNFFCYHYFLFFLLGGCLIWISQQKVSPLKYIPHSSLNSTKEYLKEFYHFSHPLFFYTLAGLVTALFDRWLLQVYGGSIQQGFLGLSNQVGAFCFLFTSAMTPLLTREFSISFANKNLAEMAHLFQRYIPVFYFIAAFFSCFISVQAGKVTYFVGGTGYQNAVIPVAIMAFYPIHQTYGQLSGSVFYASGQTKLYRNIGTVFMLAGIPVTYFLIAPAQKMGLNAGAAGLALKMVLLQFFAVNVQLYFNTRLLKISLGHFFKHQLFSAGCLIILALAATMAVDRGLGLKEHVILSFLLSGFFYFVAVAAVIYFFPYIAGFNRQDVLYILKYLFRKEEL
ncbi:MAG: Polysaccharide biosynthesis protein [Desulfotomaculum sp. 46_296]|nr:MAG: Polysaccharide biosynthesis protein [Desulfotomaculum sp. 46_296]